MTDKELLEMAAKAAGFGDSQGLHCWTESEYPRGSGLNGALWNYHGYMDTAELWNPLTDDGDALRLAVKLEIDIEFQHGYVRTTEGESDSDCNREYYVDDDHEETTRRAIVRAAAEIGKAMP